MTLILCFDTETTGLPCRTQGKTCHPSPFSLESYDGARLVQIAWQLVRMPRGTVVVEACFLVLPSGSWEMSQGAEETHHISEANVMEKGTPVEQVLQRFLVCASDAAYLVCHNIDFDLNIVLSEAIRQSKYHPLISLVRSIPAFCTMKHMTREMALPYPNGRGVGKWPKLIELHRYLFDGKEFDGAHDALEDVKATVRCFVEIIKRSR